MYKRQYKNTGEMVSLLGYGCMRLPRVAEDKQDIDQEAAEKLIDYAYLHGVNYFDTAYPYHEGKSELFVGKALKKYPRDSFFLADKMPGWLVKSLDDAKRIFEEQFVKCQVDYFDFYLCHSLSEKAFLSYEKKGICEYLWEQKEKGRIRHLGFSFHDTPEALEKIADAYNWDFAQIQLNYYDWEAQNAKRQYEILTQRNIPCIIMEPVRGGALAKLCPDSLETLHNADPKASAASWALRYAASLPNVLTVLSGMSNMEQVMDNVQTVTDFKPLTEKEYQVIDKALEQFKANKTVPCTGCRYCMDCPAGVDIPYMFTIYNEYKVSERKDNFLNQYKAAGSKQASHCVNCKKCVEHCPQKIQIPEQMKLIQACAADLDKS